MPSVPSALPYAQAPRGPGVSAEKDHWTDSAYAACSPVWSTPIECSALHVSYLAAVTALPCPALPRPPGLWERSNVWEAAVQLPTMLLDLANSGFTVAGLQPLLDAKDHPPPDPVQSLNQPAAIASTYRSSGGNVPPPRHSAIATWFARRLDGHRTGPGARIPALPRVTGEMLRHDLRDAIAKQVRGWAPPPGMTLWCRAALTGGDCGGPTRQGTI